MEEKEVAEGEKERTGESKVIIEFPWKKLILLGMVAVVLIVLFQFFKDYFEIISTNLIKQLNNLNLPFHINPYLLIAFVIIIIAVIFVLVKKIKIKSNPLKEVDDSDTNKDKFHNEEEELKKKLQEVRRKSFELAKRSKDEKVREHHDKFKNESSKPIESKQDIKKVLRTVDELLGKLPEKDIKKFSRTKEAKAYKEILKKYGVE